MKKLNISPIIFVLIFLLGFVPSKAQTADPFCQGNRIAFYDVIAYEDRKTGIKDLAAFQIFLHPHWDSSLSSDQRSDLLKERKQKIYLPVLNEIKNDTLEIAKANDIKLFDLVDYALKGYILALDESFDLSKQFIDYFNRRQKNKETTFEIRSRDATVAAINTSLLIKPEVLKGFDLKSGESEEEFCQRTDKCKDLSKPFDDFARSKKIDVLLNSRHALPDDIASMVCADLTKDFVKFYNSIKQ